MRHAHLRTVPPDSSPPASCHAFPAALSAWGERLPTDDEFDRIYPASVRGMSQHHWSNVDACVQAAEWLVATPDIRVLDIGCGPGKFCAIGAMTTPGHFTGVEQRKHLCLTARDMLVRYGIGRAQILHANITEVAFDSFDAFYLFNPFQENLLPIHKIDDAIPVCFELYDQYVSHVEQELSRMRIGTRVVTYWGDCDEIPSCYDCVDTAFDRELKLWVKHREKEDAASARDEKPLPEALEFASH